MQADKKKVGTLLKTARGQIDGILNMIGEDRYCLDISHQLMETIEILNKPASAMPKRLRNGMKKLMS